MWFQWIKKGNNWKQTVSSTNTEQHSLNPDFLCLAWNIMITEIDADQSHKTKHEWWKWRSGWETLGQSDQGYFRQEGTIKLKRRRWNKTKVKTKNKNKKQNQKQRAKFGGRKRTKIKPWVTTVRSWIGQLRPKGNWTPKEQKNQSCVCQELHKVFQNSFFVFVQFWLWHMKNTQVKVRWENKFLIFSLITLSVCWMQHNETLCVQLSLQCGNCHSLLTVKPKLKSDLLLLHNRFWLAQEQSEFCASKFWKKKDLRPFVRFRFDSFLFFFCCCSNFPIIFSKFDFFWHDRKTWIFQEWLAVEFSQ